MNGEYLLDSFFSSSMSYDLISACIMNIVSECFITRSHNKKSSPSEPIIYTTRESIYMQCFGHITYMVNKGTNVR